MQAKAAVCQACQTDQTCDAPQDLCCLCLDCREALFEVRDDVVDMLGTDRQSDGRLRDILLRKLCLAQLRVGCRRWMDDQRFDVCHVCQKREDRKIVDEAECLVLAALDLKGEDARAAAWEIAFIQRVIRMLRQRRVVDLGDLWDASR